MHVSRAISSGRWAGYTWPCHLHSIGQGTRSQRARAGDVAIRTPCPVPCHGNRKFFVTAAVNHVSNSSERRLVLIDGYAILYRSYYKLIAKVRYGKLKDANCDGSGDSVLTVFSALSSVLRLLDLLPSYAAVVFDFRGSTFRHILLPSYKGGRQPTPDAVNEAAEYLKPALVSLGIRVIEVPTVEADDVIGSLAVQAVAAGMKVRVASVDKDFFQILSPSLRLLRTLPKGPGTVSFGVEDFKKRYGDLEPSQFADMLALVGDRVDNVPGVRGIGEKTAVKLITQYGCLENLLEDLDNVPQKRVRETLLLHKSAAVLSKRLVSLTLDLSPSDLKCTLQDLAFQAPADGGRRYNMLLDAMGQFVEHSEAEHLKGWSERIWESLK